MQNYDDKPACWNRKGVRQQRTKRKSTNKLNVQIPHTEWKSPLLAIRFLYLGLAMRDGGLIRLFVLHY